MLLFTYILTNILQISNIKAYKKEKSEDQSDQIYGIFIANIILCVAVVIIYSFYDISHDIFTYDSNITLDYYGISFIHLIIHSMLFFCTDSKLKINSNVIVASFITIIINAAGIYISIIMPANEYYKSYKDRKDYVLYYLKEAYDDIFKKYIGNECKAYVPVNNFQTIDAIKLLKENYCLVVIAHPMLIKKFDYSTNRTKNYNRRCK